MSQPLHLGMPETSSEEELTPDVAQDAQDINDMDIVNHPNVPDNVAGDTDSDISSSQPKEELGIINRAFIPDETDRNQASMFKESLNVAAAMLPGAVGGQQHRFSVHKQVPKVPQQQSERQEHNMPANIQLKEESLSDQDSWIDESRDSFVTQRIRELVLAFSDRAQKIKERITRAPTPSPTPPAGDESHTGSRPRLQSLIQQEGDDLDMHVIYTNESATFWCCKKKRRKWTPSFPKILDPQSKLYISWLFFVMVSYVYNAWVIFLRAVFPYQTPENLPIFLVFDYISDLIYLIDIALFKVRLQFLHDGFWVDDPKKTRKHYFKKTMFKMDVLSLLPLDLLYFIYGANPLFRLPRFLKIQTFWEFFHRVDAVAKTPYVIRIIRTLLYMMYLIHLNACAYYAMSKWEGIGMNAWVFQGKGNEYIRCFYFATKTATSIGKNPKPENEYEYVFMTISWLMGVFIFAFLIGQIRDIVATATQSKTQYRQLMDQTVMYMRNLNLPEDLQRRVRLWLNHTWEQQKTLNEGGILDSLPRKMKTDVAINVHYNTLVKVQLFKDCDKALLRDLVLQLKPVLFLPGDYICRKGEVGKEMYIVNKGLVQVVASSENGDVVLATLSEGSVFGEISLLGIAGCSRRTADVRSQGFSNLFVLSKDDLWEALKNYPEAQEVLKRKARSLIKENEARDRASKNNNNLKIETESIIKLNVHRPRTPQLLKTVMKVVPKDSMCTQLLERKPSMKKSIHPFKTRKDATGNLPNALTISTFIKISPSRKSSETVSRTISSPQISGKVRGSMPKKKSASATTLRYFSPPGSYDDLKAMQNVKDKTAAKSPAPKLENSLNSDLQRRKSSEDAKDLFKSILSLIPKDYNGKKQNVVHPASDQSDTTEDESKQNNPNNTSSEDSGISVDLKNRKSVKCQQAPVETQESCFSGMESDDSELSMMSIKTTAAGEGAGDNGTRNKGDLGYHTWVSPSSSVFSLQSLFRTNSSKSSSTTEREPSVEHSVQQDQKDSYRPPSSTSDISSAGYDNLAFVPVDILSSRRSSMFSDDVSC